VNEDADSSANKCGCGEVLVQTVLHMVNDCPNTALSDDCPIKLHFVNEGVVN